MKIQIISDLHLDYYTNRNELISFKKIIKPEAEYLFLAGDICTLDCIYLKQFLKYISKNWKKIFYVLGNHEYYQCNENKKCYDDLNNIYNELIKNYSNIYFLSNTTKNIYHINYNNNIYFIIGNTMWSKCKNRGINNTTHIYKDATSKIDYEWMCEKYSSCLNKLKISNYNDYINKVQLEYPNSKINFMLLTHFPISKYELTSWEGYHSQSDGLQSYFCNDIITAQKINNELTKYDIMIAGHTHYSYNYMDNNIRFISNQIGYPDELKTKNRTYIQNCIFFI